MSIRQIRSDELDKLLVLYGHLHTADAPLPDRSVVNSVWSEILGSPRYAYFGYFLDDDLISSCTITIVPNLTRECKSYGVIENVVTHAEFRNRGYGKAVLSFALAHAWNLGCYKVMLLTGRKDRATLRFYESAGFDGTEKQAFIAKPQS